MNHEVECTFCGVHLHGETRADIATALLDHDCAERAYDAAMSASLPTRERVRDLIASNGGWRRIRPAGATP